MNLRTGANGDSTLVSAAEKPARLPSEKPHETEASPTLSQLPALRRATAARGYFDSTDFAVPSTDTSAPSIETRLPAPEESSVPYSFLTIVVSSLFE